MIAPHRLAPPENSCLVVVGGCGGIGRALVRLALANSLRVAVIDLPDVIRTFPPPAEVLSFAADATCEEAVRQAFVQIGDAWGVVDGLVNLAGFLTTFETVEHMDYTDWRYVYEGSLLTTLFPCKHALPLLRKSKRTAAIVNMTTGIAYIGRPRYGPYAAAKAAIVSLTKTLAAENAPKIRVNAVAPGAVDTPFLSGGTAHGGIQGEKARRINVEEYLKSVPMGYLATPDDVAEPILFLLSDAARYITGQVLHINGGALMV
ncbi:MAG: SDR family NAD(P)-dependent oxidoreductase [Cytophagales bacterium]|nr:SDR family oxidoreductase [Bernardetiaceae bacterium]MDW8204390.1 SDR family NAD(P)-dependent oxidoreductase [Cytophagales bacterium]